MSGFLSRLESPRGANKRKKRLGRGDASGHGGTSTKGHKGQRARAGGYHKLAFEGGQNPLYRRIPKRGFTNIFREEFAVVNLNDLSGFKAGTVVDSKALHEKGLLRNVKKKLKILGGGEISVGLTVRAHRFSKSAADKIEKAGGKVESLEDKSGKA